MKELLDRYFWGELSDLEKKKLFDLIESDNENKTEFIHTQHAVTLSSLLPKKGDKEWTERMRLKLDARIKRRRNRRLAVRSFKYAAVFALLTVNAWFISEKITGSRQELLFTTIEVPKGQRVSMTFADGTEAWLSPRTVVKMPNDFNRKNRTIELDGEGFFSVTKDTQKPFIVKTRQYDIKVLGTKFNVFAYSENPRFEADLVEGCVQIMSSSCSENYISLKPNEKASLVNDRLVKSYSIFDNEEYLKNGIFNFKNKQFTEILDYLSLWNNIKFELKAATQLDRPISGKFRQSDEIENILKALQEVHRFKFRKIADERIEIY